MNTIKVTIREKTAIITLDRGRSNAINTEMVAELSQMIENIERDDSILGVIIGGKEGYFSAGLDLIELYNYNEVEIKTFWEDFLNLVSSLTTFKKPLIAAISGHAPAGGCLLSLCCDYRIMAEGKYIIGLNEVPVGLIIPESIFAIYSFWLGKAKAYRYLLEGKLLGPATALEVGLVDEVVNIGSILTAAERQMQKYIMLDANTWRHSKLNMRTELIKQISQDQTETIEKLLKQWWSPQSRAIISTIIKNLSASKS
ncbi:MAG: Enoyl-CoA hydratase/carnithine racemase [Sphingobacteriales bacterium]|nr:Enoyl-CoA hydratase/carnithine racemase [Sphingobacteriales bacterium]